MAHHDVGAGFDGRMRDGAFIRREASARVNDAFVKRHDHEI